VDDGDGATAVAVDGVVSGVVGGVVGCVVGCVGSGAATVGDGCVEGCVETAAVSPPAVAGAPPHPATTASGSSTAVASEAAPRLPRMLACLLV
jgi:hypothetical protein